MTEMDINEILAAPAAPLSRSCMIDRVLDCEPGKRIVALKNVSANEPYFQGHFPAPADHAGRADPRGDGAGRRRARRSRTHAARRRTRSTVYYFVGIDNARFKKPVVPGDQLELEVHVERALRGIGKFSCVARVDGEVVAEATILLRACSPPSDMTRRSIRPRSSTRGARLADGVEVGPYSRHRRATSRSARAPGSARTW